MANEQASILKDEATLNGQALKGYMVDFYNLLMYSKLRLSLKYAPLKNNPSDFKNIENEVLDHLVSSTDDSELPFSTSTLSLPSGALVSIKSDDGYKHTKSYTFGLEPS